MVINILMIIKKRIGGKYAALPGDFALEPSENSVIFRSIPTNLYHFECLFVIKKKKKTKMQIKKQ